MFVHAFGAYFGVTIGIVTRWRNYDKSAAKQGTTGTSDMFSLLGNNCTCYHIYMLPLKTSVIQPELVTFTHLMHLHTFLFYACYL